MNQEINELHPSMADRSLTEKKTAQETNAYRKILETIKGVASFSEILRFSGAAVMVASMSLFLIDGFEVTNDIQRYLTLLCQTLLLTGGGLAMSYVLRENKGARVFFGLGIISIPANFAVLGAMIYSFAPWDSMSADYPAFAHWVTGGDLTTMATLVGAVVLLTPIALLGFSVMARDSARALTLAFTLANTALLIPVRNTMIVAPLAVAVSLGLLWYVRNTLSDSLRLKTGEGRFARTALFIAPGILFARSLYLYDFHEVVVFLAMGTVYLCLRQISMREPDVTRFRTLVEVTSLPVGILAAISAGVWFGDTNERFGFLVMAIAVTGVSIELASRVGSNTLRSAVSAVGAVITGVVLAIIPVFGHFGIVELLGLVAAVALSAIGILRQSRIQTVSGILATIIMLLCYAGPLIDSFNLGSWSLLAILGASAIVLGSLIDRHGATIKLRLQGSTRKEVCTPVDLERIPVEG